VQNPDDDSVRAQPIPPYIKIRVPETVAMACPNLAGRDVRYFVRWIFCHDLRGVYSTFSPDIDAEYASNWVVLAICGREVAAIEGIFEIVPPPSDAYDLLFSRLSGKQIRSPPLLPIPEITRREQREREWKRERVKEREGSREREGV